ncbi:MAG: hypothetical protein ACFFCD_17575 [Promethearchaeota archaeon]
MKTWKKVLLIFVLAIFLVPALFVTVNAQPHIISTSTENSNHDENEQYPNYTSSINTPENATDQQLAALATINPDQAKTSALNDPTVAGGTVTSVSLDNEY